tara:strand:- start:259 stop:384 length:126 start_codon:yes stop_codon:yes gene_type:complete
MVVMAVAMKVVEDLEPQEVTLEEAVDLAEVELVDIVMEKLL